MMVCQTSILLNMSPRLIESKSGDRVAGINLLSLNSSKTIVFQEIFFDILFNCTGNPITNITNVR